MDQQAIFQTQINNQQTDIQQDNTEIPLCNPYLKKGDSSKYIDQFLQKTPLVQQKCSQQNFNIKIPAKIQQHQQQESISAIIQNLTNVQHQENQPTSIFHNFQKHLCIFLKRHLKSIKKQQMSDVQLVSEKLRRAFMDSTVNSKKLILFIFGQQNLKGRQKTLKQYGVKQIYTKYSPQQIRKGKQLLREQTLKQFQDVNVKQYLSGTRIKNKQYFVLYVKNFMSQLQNGIFRKRIKKQGVIDN